MGATTTLVTFEEFERFPDEEGKLELLDGEVLRLPPANFRHMDIAMRVYDLLKELLRLLHDQDQARDLGRVCIETGYHIGNNWLIPDVSITHAGQSISGYLEGAPPLAIEVMSESNTAPMLQRKIRKYFENGGREAWAFYPDTASVWMYSGKTAVEHEGTLTSGLLPGISIDLAQIFA